MKVTIEVSSTHPGVEWRTHLASELALLHPGADIRVAYGLADDAFVWSDEFGFLEERESRTSRTSRTSIAEEFIRDSRDSFTAAVLAAEDLGERVEAEVREILRAWTRAGRSRTARVWD